MKVGQKNLFNASFIKIVKTRHHFVSWLEHLATLRQEQRRLNFKLDRDGHAQNKTRFISTLYEDITASS